MNKGIEALRWSVDEGHGGRMTRILSGGDIVGYAEMESDAIRLKANHNAALDLLDAMLEAGRQREKALRDAARFMQPSELDAFTNHVRALEQEAARLDRELLAARAELAPLQQTLDDFVAQGFRVKESNRLKVDGTRVLQMSLATAHLEFLAYPEIVWDCLRRKAHDAR